MNNSPSDAPDPNAVDPNSAQTPDNNEHDPWALNEQNASTPPTAPEAQQEAPKDETTMICEWWLKDKLGMDKHTANAVIMATTDGGTKPFIDKKFLRAIKVQSQVSVGGGGPAFSVVEFEEIKRQYLEAHPAPQAPAAPKQTNTSARTQGMPASPYGTDAEGQFFPEELLNFKWDLRSRIYSEDWSKITNDESEFRALYKAYLATNPADISTLDDFLKSRGIAVVPPGGNTHDPKPNAPATQGAPADADPYGIEKLKVEGFKWTLNLHMYREDWDKLTANEEELTVLFREWEAVSPLGDTTMLDDFLNNKGIVARPAGVGPFDPKPNASATQPGAPAPSSPSAPADPNAPAPKPTPEQFFQNFIYWFKRAVDPEIFKKFTDQDLRNLHVEYSNADPLKVRDMADFARIKGFTKPAPAPAAPESAEYDPTDLRQFIEDVSKLLYEQDSRQMGNDVFRDIQGLWINKKPKDASGLRIFLEGLSWDEGKRKLLLVPPGGSPKDPKPAVPEAENFPGNRGMYFLNFRNQFEQAVGPENIKNFTEQDLRDLHDEFSSMYKEGKVKVVANFAELKGYAKPATAPEKIEAEYDPSDLKQFKKDVRELLYEQDYKLLRNAEFKDIQSWWIKDNPKDTSGLRKFLEGMSWDDGKRKLLLVPPGGSPIDPKPVVSDAENYPGNPPEKSGLWRVALPLGLVIASLGGVAYLVSKTDGCNSGKGESAAIPSAKASGSAKAPASATVAQPKKTAPVVVATPPVVPTVTPPTTPTAQATTTVAPVAPPVETAPVAPTATLVATATAAPTATPTAPKQPARPSFWTTNKPSKIIVKCDNFVIPTNCELPPDCRQMRTFLSERVRIICEAANNRAVYETWQPGEGIYPHGKGVEIKLHLVEEE